MAVVKRVNVMALLAVIMPLMIILTKPASLSAQPPIFFVLSGDYSDILHPPGTPPNINLDSSAGTTQVQVQFPEASFGTLQVAFGPTSAKITGKLSDNTIGYPVTVNLKLSVYVQGAPGTTDFGNILRSLRYSYSDTVQLSAPLATQGVGGSFGLSVIDREVADLRASALAGPLNQTILGGDRVGCCPIFQPSSATVMYQGALYSYAADMGFGGTLVADVSGTSAQQSFDIQLNEGGLAAPTNLQATQIGFNGNQVQLTWDYGSDPIDGFELDRQTPSQKQTSTWPTPPILIPTSNCSPASTGFSCTYTDTAPTAYATYNYRLRAYKGTVESSNSNESAAFQLMLSTISSGREMFGSFQPDPSLGVTQVANVFGFNHFNWVRLL